MMLSGTISRPSPATLVVATRRTGALLRLLIWLAIVGGFYRVLLGDGAPPQGASWLLLLVPLFLLPYLIDGLAVLIRGRVHTFDGARRELRTTRRAPVPFAAIRGLEVRAVNGSCEESTVTARLTDGSAVVVATGARIAATIALANELGALVGVAVERRT